MLPRSPNLNIICGQDLSSLQCTFKVSSKSGDVAWYLFFWPQYFVTGPTVDAGSRRRAVT